MNGSRSRPDTRLVTADLVRIPPMTDAADGEPLISPAKHALIARSIVFENDSLLVLNKPAGMAVHGGSGLRFGIINIVRALRGGEPGIELVHRLDRETSGCLVFAKNYPALRRVQQQLASRDSHKTYLALLHGEMSRERTEVDLSLSTTRAGGEKRSVVADDGKRAVTEFTVIETIVGMSLVYAEITTGRTHQIRAHAAAIGHPVAGDTKYGDEQANRVLRRRGLRRMFLHASSITLQAAPNTQPIVIEAPLADELKQFLELLRCRKSD